MSLIKVNQIEGFSSDQITINGTLSATTIYVGQTIITNSGITISGNTVISGIGTSFNQAANFLIFTGSVVNITGTNSINYIAFNYIDPSNISHYVPAYDFISSTTSAFTVNGDFSEHIPNLPITTTTFYLSDGNGINLNKYYYTLPTITSITYNSGSNISTFVFLNPLETTYYYVDGIGSSTLGDYSTAEGVSVNALSDYSHAEGGFNTTGIWAYYSSSIIDGVITIENIKSNQQYNILNIEKYNKQYILFDDSAYIDDYGYNLFSITSLTYNESAQTITIYLEDTSINSLEALIGCTDPESNYTIPFQRTQHAEGFYTFAASDSSHSEGSFTITLGEGAHSEGIGTTAGGPFSHSEGDGTGSFGWSSHAEGRNTFALGEGSHAEGENSQSYGVFSHAEGNYTFAINEYSHTEGSATFTPTVYTYITSVDTGTNTITVTNVDNFSSGNAVAYVRSAGGNNNNVTTASILSINVTAKTITLNDVDNINSNVFWGLNGNLSSIGVLFKLESNEFSYGHAEGSFTAAIGDNSHAEGRKNAALGNHSHAEGVLTQAAGTASHSEGISTQANADNSHAEGEDSKAGINTIPAYVVDTTTLRLDSDFGDLTKSIAFYDLNPGDLKYIYINNYYFEYNNLGSTIIEYDGTNTYITGGSSLPSYLVGQEISIYNPKFSRIEDFQTYPDGNSYNRYGYASHAEGNNTLALGEYSHAEGDNTKTFGDYSHAEGNYTLALGEGSHAEGNYTLALGEGSHAEGSSGMGGGIAAGDFSHVEGVNNIAGSRVYYTDTVSNGVITFSNQSGNDLTDVFTEGQEIMFNDVIQSNTYGIVTTNVSSSTYDGTYTYVTCSNTNLNGASFIVVTNNPNPRLSNDSIGDGSHAEGLLTKTYGNYSHAEGEGTITLTNAQHASGKYNRTGNTESIFIVGNGYNNTERSDIFYINQNSVNVEGRFDNGYRTYRALLTHIPQQASITETPQQGLIIGETYKIVNYVSDDDFLNVGATNNQTEEQFTATGRFPTRWTNGSTLSVQIPTFIVDVLENTFDDDIVWTLNPFGEGTYAATFSGQNQTFPREKTTIVTTPTTPYDYYPFATQPTISSGIYSFDKIDDTIEIGVNAYDGTWNYLYNGLLFYTPIEIKSYVGFKPTVYLNSYTPNYSNGTADFDVTLASSGSSKVTEYGIVWSTLPNPTINDYKSVFGTSIGTSTINVDFNGTTFGQYTYVRAYAINNAGVTYHEVNQISFTPND